jgi:hypothetical protein
MKLFLASLGLAATLAVTAAPAYAYFDWQSLQNLGNAIQDQNFQKAANACIAAGNVMRFDYYDSYARVRHYSCVTPQPDPTAAPPVNVNVNLPQPVAPAPTAQPSVSFWLVGKGVHVGPFTSDNCQGALNAAIRNGSTEWKTYRCVERVASKPAPTQEPTPPAPSYSAPQPGPSYESDARATPEPVGGIPQ